MIATIILLALHAASIGVNLAKHGEKRIEGYNVWSCIICSSIIMILYYYAGLFDKFFDQ